METIALPILLTTAGAIIMKLLDSFIGRPARKADEATRVRAELRGDLDNLRQRYDRVRESEAEWRERHFASLAEIADLKEQVRRCDERTAELSAANYMLTQRIAALERRHPPG